MPLFEHTTSLRVRYAETDQMGIVWHGGYLLYFEVGRTEALRACGWSYRGLEESGVLLPVVEAHIDYARSARYDDLITIRTTVREPPTVRLRFDYEVLDESGAQLVSGYTVLAFLDAMTRRPCRPPPRLRAFFTPAAP